MKKYYILYIADALFIIFFFVMAYKENLSSNTGMAALGTLGRFVLYSVLCLFGLLLFLILIAFHIIQMRKNKKSKE